MVRAVPADVLGVGGVADAPLVHVEALAAGGGAGLLAAVAALHLARVEVLQDAAHTSGYGEYQHGGQVMVSTSMEVRLW